MVLTDKTTKQVDDFVQKWTNKVDSITVQDMLYASNSDAGNEGEEKFKSEEKSRIAKQTYKRRKEKGILSTKTSFSRPKRSAYASTRASPRSCDPSSRAGLARRATLRWRGSRKCGAEPPMCYKLNSIVRKRVLTLDAVAPAAAREAPPAAATRAGSGPWTGTARAAAV